MIRLVEKIQVGGLDVEVRELTVGEIRNWLASVARLPMAEDVVDVVDVMLLDQVRLLDLSMLSTITPAQIEQLAPSHLRQVLEAAKQLTPDFFAMRQRLEEVGLASIKINPASWMTTNPES